MDTPRNTPEKVKEEINEIMKDLDLPMQKAIDMEKAQLIKFMMGRWNMMKKHMSQCMFLYYYYYLMCTKTKKS